MKLYYYLLYRVVREYKNANLPATDPGIWGSGLVSMVLTMNIFSLLFIFTNTYKWFFEGNYFVIIGFSFFFTISLLNDFLILKNNRSYQNYKEIWEEDDQKKRIIKGTYVVLYLLLSFALIITAFAVNYYREN
jgi:hypothetical protein